MLSYTQKRGIAVAKVRFPLGQVLGTPGALRAIEEAGQEPAEFLKRHQAVD